MQQLVQNSTTLAIPSTGVRMMQEHFKKSMANSANCNGWLGIYLLNEVVWEPIPGG